MNCQVGFRTMQTVNIWLYDVVVWSVVLDWLCNLMLQFTKTLSFDID